MNETKRTLRERKFIESYIGSGGNATEAYLAINNKANKNTAGVLGNRMLRNVNKAFLFGVTRAIKEAPELKIKGV